MRHVFTTVLLLLLMAAGCDYLPGGSTTVRGTVRDAATGLPIDSIYVALNPPGTIESIVYGFTDPSGAFSITSSDNNIDEFRANAPQSGRFLFFNQAYGSFLESNIREGRINEINVLLNPVVR